MRSHRNRAPTLSSLHLGAENMHMHTCTHVRVYAHARVVCICKPSEESHGQGQLKRTGSLLELRSAVPLPMSLFKSRYKQFFLVTLKVSRGYLPQYSLGLQA